MSAKNYHLATGNKDLENLIDAWEEAYAAGAAASVPERGELRCIFYQLIGYAAMAKKMADTQYEQSDRRSTFERVFGKGW